MKSRETLIRLRRFEVDEKRQKVTDLETMIGDFERMATDLERQIQVEQERAGVSDVNHFAYPTFAKAAIQRRDNLIASVDDLQAKLDMARTELTESYEELKKVELIEERDMERARAVRLKAEQVELDDLGRMAHLSAVGQTR